jgi:TPR repeat protein
MGRNAKRNPQRPLGATITEQTFRNWCQLHKAGNIPYMPVKTRLCWLIVFSIIAASLCQAQEPGSRLDDANAVTEPSFQQKAAAGDREAQNQLGITAQDNHDYRGAFKWFQLAANQGLSGAQVGLGFLYDMGLGVEKDSDQAAHWYGLAAAQGDPDGEFDLAMCYLHGEGIEQDQILARKWFSSALKHGDGGRSLNGIGLTYDDGSRRDYAEAFHWYSKAAEMGFGEAQYNVCRRAAQGLGTAADYPEAIKWCSKAADSGDEWGQFGMGRIYEDGTGVPPDLAKAAEWYRKSAEQGNPAAQLSLGAMYSDGKGVRRDLVQAYMWVAVAGSGKHPDAQAALETLTDNMNKRQISAAQALALKWTGEHPRDPEKSLDHIEYNP